MKYLRWIFGVLALLSLTSCTIANQPKPAVAPGTGDIGPLGLEVIPWEGGPAYWSSFDKAKAAGWTDSSFFPIVVWYNGVSSQAEVDFDKSLGINTYIGMPQEFDSRWLNDNGMFWIGGAINDTFTQSTPSWVGYILDDEVDGRFEPAAGREHLSEIRRQVPPGLFSYANYTYMVLENDMADRDSTAYINDFTDVVSVDKYWYTIPHCSNMPYRDVSIVPIVQESCRSSSSYGRTMQALRLRDSEDGVLQPLWQFIENMGGADREENFSQYIEPDQLRGAVMNSLIHEARGIVYFNQALSGTCKGSNVFRLAQVVQNYCGAAQVEAARKINAQIHQLAPVLNTQSLKFTFNSGIDSMLKVVDGYAYVFAMLGPGQEPGSYQLKLPEGVTGKEVQVLFEERNLTADQGGFADDFSHEYSYHVYKVKL